jgi:hypothetical protein
MLFGRLRKQLEGLLDLLPGMYDETGLGEVALGAALKGLLAGLVRYFRGRIQT